MANSETDFERDVMDSPQSETVAPKRHSDKAPRQGFIRRNISSVVVMVVIIAVVALIKTFIVQNFSIPSASMERTLMTGDRIIVSVWDREDVKRGDVVVFEDPDNWLPQLQRSGVKGAAVTALEYVHLLPKNSGKHLIKRVIGVPGDHIVADGSGPMTINGVKVNETYLAKGVHSSDMAFDITVPAGYVWVMGDNRNNSADSRMHQSDAHHGLVPIKNIVGKTRMVVWPLSHWSSVDSKGVFNTVPSAKSTPTSLPNSTLNPISTNRVPKDPAPYTPSPTDIESTEPDQGHQGESSDGSQGSDSSGSDSSQSEEDSGQ